MTDVDLQWIIDVLRRAAGECTVAEDARFDRALAAVVGASDDDVTQLLDALASSRGLDDPRQAAAARALLQQLITRRQRVTPPRDDGRRECIFRLHNALGHSPAVRALLLQYLATAAGPDDLRLFARLMVDHPLPEPALVAVAIAPLLQQQPHYDPTALFPELLEALQHASAAAIILDLANYLVRTRRVTAHPAAEHAAALVSLLGSLVQRLAQLEEAGGPRPGEADTVRRQVDDSVALIVSLCDALALLGESRAVGKLYQALELKHRRVHVEAAAALARLGEPIGGATLVAAAAEPVMRLRALAAAEESGLIEQVDPAYRTGEALAESEVAVTLAQPTFFGLPPQELTCIDTRDQYWPGYEQRVTCYLYRYVYRFGGGDYTNVAIAGPLVHAFTADLTDLAPADIYAAYAGWHATHPDIEDWPVERCPAAWQADMRRLERRLDEQGFRGVQGVTFGSFIGDAVLVAQAERRDVAGVVVVDQQRIEWHPAGSGRHLRGPDEAFCIYKGRRLLRAFNP